MEVAGGKKSSGMCRSGIQGVLEQGRAVCRDG